MIRRLLVANRGEIARRVFATCRRMGIETVAVYADADRRARHAREADLAVRLPGHSPGETYLRVDQIVAAAKRSGADGVHPGYGFLSEQADFAAAVGAAGLVWVGPPAAAIAAMASKVEAKALLAAAGVPTLPSWNQPADITEFPVLLKASAGGGGRGMRIVTNAADLADALAGARREALSAFGDDTVFGERYVETGRHIEVQIFADTHGTVLAFGERECSVQRRHQKIIEESPSPAVDAGLRTQLSEAAVTAARAVGYVGAGTVEFLVDPDGQFYFLEMNTRLQVEHPVTECVTGLDLVRLQLEVAQGQPVTPPPEPRGHAIEARLYAEDPANGWQPATGVLHRFRIDADAEFAGLDRPGIRVDAGVTDGDEVGIHYDPMLAKVVAWAPTRAEAARRLATALHRAHLHGVVTNRDLLVRVLRSDEFLAGRTDTAFLHRHPEVFAPLVDSPSECAVAALAAGLAAGAARRRDQAWGALPAGWRNVAAADPVASYRTPSGEVEVSYRRHRTGSSVDWSGEGEVGIVELTPDLVVLEVAGLTRRFSVQTVGAHTYVDFDQGAIDLVEVPRFPPPGADRPAGSLIAPMPGALVRIAVAVGDRVAGGDLLLTLEAMKLEHAVRAPEPGVVTELPVPTGTQVEAGAVLAVVTPDDDLPVDGEP